MSDLEQTGNPPQEASTSETTAAPAQPFWETMDEAPAEQTPEPTAEVESESPETPEAEAAEPPTEAEEDANWLPDEQQKVFPDEVLAKYAKRYGRSMEQLQADPQLKQLVIDKINSDILIQKQQESETAEAEEPTPEEAAEPAAPVTAAPNSRDEWLEQVVTKNVDPKAVEQFGYKFLVAAGVDPNNPENAAVLKTAGAVGKELTRGAVDLFTTIAPQMQMQMLEASMPGITEMYQRSLHQLQWERVSAGNPNLPAYGTKQFQEAITKAAKEVPGFEQMVFTDKAGRALPYHEQAAKRYEFLASRMAGQTVTPQAVQQALEKGKQQAKDADRNRAAGKVLGAGQSKKQFAPGSENEFRSWIEEYNASQRSAPLKG